MKTAALVKKDVVVRSPKLAAKAKPASMRAFKLFTEDCDRVVNYLADLHEAVHNLENTHFTADGLAGDASMVREWLVDCARGFARFERNELYEDDADTGERVLSQEHMAKRLSITLVQFHN